MVMKDSINTVGKGLYKGKKTLHEIMAGAKKAEKLEEAAQAKAKNLSRSKTTFLGAKGAKATPKAKKSPPP